ncbi:hypothetical protein T439DRAFT_329526 [Meredithblackwellia eburnea MCA 4105]
MLRTLPRVFARVGPHPHTRTHLNPRRRQMHLLQSTSLSLLKSQGLPVIPFKLITSSQQSHLDLDFDSNDNENKVLWAQVGDAAGIAACCHDGASFAHGLRGVRFEVDSSTVKETLSTLLSTPLSLPNAPTGMQTRESEGVMVTPLVRDEDGVRVLFYCHREGTEQGPGMLGARSSDLDTFSSLREFSTTTSSSSSSPKTFFLPISITTGLPPSTSTKLLETIAPPSWGREDVDAAANVLQGVYDGVFVGLDCLRVEVWLNKGDKGEVSITNAQIQLDPFAFPRHTNHSSLSSAHLHPSELEASTHGLFYIKPPVTPSQPRGNIGCFGYGAGLAMATMDAVVAAGGAVAAGIIEAVRETPRLDSGQVPMVVRIRGTNETQAKKLSGIPFILETEFKEAAQRAVEAARQL